MNQSPPVSTKEERKVLGRKLILERIESEKWFPRNPMMNGDD